MPCAQCGWQYRGQARNLHVTGGKLTWGWAGGRCRGGKQTCVGAGMPLELVAPCEPLATEEPVADKGPLVLHTPGPPVPWGPGPAPPALTLLPTAPSPSARDGVGLACPWDDRPLSAPPSCPRASSLSLTLQGCGAQLTSPLGLLAPASLSDAPVLLASPLALQPGDTGDPGSIPGSGRPPGEG